MLNPPGIAERIVYGRPVDQDDTKIAVAMRPTTALIGRTLLGLIFLISGAMKLADVDHIAAIMTQIGIPSAPFLAVVAGLAEVLGGLGLITGCFARLAALGLFIYLIPTTLLFHAFWNATGTAQQMQAANFLKNLAIMGGLALVYAYGPGRFSLDARMRRTTQP